MTTPSFKYSIGQSVMFGGQSTKITYRFVNSGSPLYVVQEPDQENCPGDETGCVREYELSLTLPRVGEIWEDDSGKQFTVRALTKKNVVLQSNHTDNEYLCDLGRVVTEYVKVHNSSKF